MLLIIYILNYLLFQFLQQLHTPHLALFGLLLSFTQVVFLTPLLMKRLSLSLLFCFLSLSFAVLIVCPFCLIWVVICFSLAFLSSRYLVLLSI